MWKWVTTFFGGLIALLGSTGQGGWLVDTALTVVIWFRDWWFNLLDLGIDYLLTQVGAPSTLPAGLVAILQVPLGLIDVLIPWDIVVVLVGVVLSTWLIVWTIEMMWYFGAMVIRAVITAFKG